MLCQELEQFLFWLNPIRTGCDAVYKEGLWQAHCLRMNGKSLLKGNIVVDHYILHGAVVVLKVAP